MKRKESSDSNPSPDARADGDPKAEATLRAAENSRAVTENSRASGELRREQSEGDRRGVVPGTEDVFQNLAEVQLRLLKPAIEQSNESIIIMKGQLDPPGPQIVYLNPAFTKMTGYAPEDVIGKTPCNMLGVFPITSSGA